MGLYSKIAVGGLLAICAGGAGLEPMASAATAYVITATNVMMSSRTGMGTSQYSITGIPVTGTITLSCGYSGSLALGRLPICPMTPPVAYQVVAGGTLSGKVTFFPPTTAVPALAPMAGMALGGVLLLGLRRRRGSRNALAFLVLAGIGLAGISSCGGNSSDMPPGTYPYTITASNSPAVGTGPVVVTSTIIMVTVP